MEETMNKVYKKVCKRCNKEIISLSKSQCEYNFLIHNFACKKRKVSEEEIINPEKNDN